jgi:hypothetical protein
MGTMVKPARAVPDIALLPLRELVLSLLLLNTLIATLLTLILPLSTFWVNMVYSHLIGACICTLTEVGRRLLWTRCGWPSPWRFGLLLLGSTVLGASLGATLAGWVGLKTAQEIRKIDSNIEMIIMTAYTDIKREELVNKIGKPEKLLYLKKPFEKEEILQVVLSLTTKWSLEQKVKNQLQVIKNSKQTLEEVINGISEIEKSVPFSLKIVYKTIAEEFMKIIKCEKAYLVMENEVFRWGELGEDCLAFEELKDRVVENKSYVIDSTKIYVNFFCDKNYCDINGAIGVFKSYSSSYFRDNL